MGPRTDQAETLTGITKDECEWEQSALLREYVLSRTDDDPPGEWSSRGKRSLAPFLPTASTRIPHIFAAARLRETDVFYDIGCGDGRILHEAAARYGCRCVGLDIDEDCLRDCRRGADAFDLATQKLFRWEHVDMMELPDDFFVTGILPCGGEPLPQPTAVVMFCTGHGFVALADWLHRAWRRASSGVGGGVRILTCVESLDTCVDYNEGIFSETNAQQWDVYRDPVHARCGVFVVPPFGCDVDSWRSSAPVPVPLSGCCADQSDSALLRALLDKHEIVTVCKYVESLVLENEGFHANRVTLLYKNGADYLPLRRVWARLLRGLHKADEERWNLLRGRSVYVRSFEHHSFEPGDSVTDAMHCDVGSLLTVSVLLSRSEVCEGRLFRTGRGCSSAADGFGEDNVDMSPGDAVVFISDKANIPTPLTAGRQTLLVMELAEVNVNTHNTHLC
eukprot:TRINITY_DN55431_c0_g1_i1.p1 TRINITY_DN55431_c0_g1~~TRINITY_DN55431_c0_g1_i1.p1  ORF type:complete len:449 (+),score=59.23 TRINITY_DN55431_c0_g1_i1:142-1488(+)